MFEKFKLYSRSYPLSCIESFEIVCFIIQRKIFCQVYNLKSVWVMNGQNFDNIQQRRSAYGAGDQPGGDQQQQQQQPQSFQFNLFNQNVASTMGAYVNLVYI